MPDADCKAEPPTSTEPSPAGTQSQPEDTMDDEEKVVAGRDDANLPALLTRDVPGG